MWHGLFGLGEALVQVARRPSIGVGFEDGEILD